MNTKCKIYYNVAENAAGIKFWDYIFGERPQRYAFTYELDYLDSTRSEIHFYAHAPPSGHFTCCYRNYSKIIGFRKVNNSLVESYDIQL